MQPKNTCFCLLINLLIACPALAADTYVIDPIHTNVGFAVKHLVITNVHGTFKDFAGLILFDEKAPSQSSVTGAIKTASISTDNNDRDKDLKSPNFLDVEKYPEITFKSTKVERKGDQYQVAGDLTIRDVTKHITFPVEISGPIKDPLGNVKIGMEFSLTINRQDYGLTYNKTIDTGGLVVGNEVKISVSAEAAKKK